ncbi:uncharacterized protein K02A2.6-like [Armigeres subalbatus]|uniref:uncharacterized protein K02A2.6-like n=1 Tax=Armigeres subalbatus TaxID=124917 RepID=UPI002ED20E27
MDAMLSGIPGTSPYLDDILIGGRNAEEHKRNLYLVLQRLQEYGFTVKLEKCRFFMHQVKYLGQLLDSEGTRPDPNKVKAIVNMPLRCARLWNFFDHRASFPMQLTATKIASSTRNMVQRTRPSKCKTRCMPKYTMATTGPDAKVKS